ncbi:hypothetical protein GUJ93_ZPchr0001g29832 [Zizania palustris]|uniref:Uncharacterized protein n=1 Tax=Zizania palustris TaxID=103762 RepID=A0A8J5R6Y0_ZIZPA|nr:hypothetical protein GUJ93_ZPchr0001g29832 [Zizania palustris]
MGGGGSQRRDGRRRQLAVQQQEVSLHDGSLVMFRSNSHLDLLKVKKTRFASHYISLQRLITCRDVLATTVVTRQWKDWVNSCTNDVKQQARAIVLTINDDNFWAKAENIIAIIGPIYSVLRFNDGEGPKMGEIYEDGLYGWGNQRYNDKRQQPTQRGFC